MERGYHSHDRGTEWERTILQISRFALPCSMALETRRDRETSTQVAVRKFNTKHRFVVPTRQPWIKRRSLATPKFHPSSRHPAPAAILPIALRPVWCQYPSMNLFLPRLLGSLAILALPLTAADPANHPKTEAKPESLNGIPADLVDDPHLREELAVNEFTAPSIAKVFDTLQFLMPLPVVETERKMPARMPMDRADLAIELGFLIADGFLVVQAEQLEKVEGMAKDLTRYGKALGAGDRVNRHAAGLLESAKKKDVTQLKKELSATQRDVEVELVTLRDADLAHLISLGGWIRALEVSTVAVDKQFSAERARKVMREDIADYYTESVAGLEPRISERPNYLAMRDLLAGLRSEMVLKDGEDPTPATMKELRQQAAKLVELALQRKK